MEQNDTNLLDMKMVVAAECLANPAFGGTKDDIANMAGVSRSTLYRWFRNDEFIELVNSLINKYVTAEAGMVWKALLKECSSGNIQAIRLYFEMKEKANVGKADNEEASFDSLITAIRGNVDEDN